MITTRFIVFCSLAWLLFNGAILAAAADSMARGKVVGIVSVAGVADKPKPLPVFKSRSFCGATVANETLLVGADGRLRNAAVILRPLSGGTVAQPKKLVLDNQHCAFTPHVQVAPLGSELLLKNSDPILHTVHARLGRETLFNVGLPKWRQVTKRLDRAGVIRIDCDVLHTWMSAVIIVTDSPYSYVSTEKGEFQFDDIPDGSYELVIWHERLGRQSQRIVVRDNGTTAVDVILSLEKKR
ncbi:MAG: hypothetical protein ACXWYD_02970 [Candidatus Binatia bacterium]